MDNLNVIDRLMQVFIRYIDSGFGLLGGDVHFLTVTLIGFVWPALAADGTDTCEIPTSWVATWMVWDVEDERPSLVVTVSVTA